MITTILAAVFTVSSALAAAPAAKPEAKAEARAEGNKAPLLARFEKTCLQNSAAEGRSQKDLCACLKSNLGAKLSSEQLSLLVRFYEGDAAAKAAVQKTENSPLLDFDMETAEHCLADTKWKATEGPRPPDADEHDGEAIVEAEKVKETLKVAPETDAKQAAKSKIKARGEPKAPAKKAAPAKKKTAEEE